MRIIAMAAVAATISTIAACGSSGSSGSQPPKAVSCVMEMAQTGALSSGTTYAAWGEQPGGSCTATAQKLGNIAAGDHNTVIPAVPQEAALSCSANGIRIYSAPGNMASDLGTWQCSLISQLGYHP